MYWYQDISVINALIHGPIPASSLKQPDQDNARSSISRAACPLRFTHLYFVFPVKKTRYVPDPANNSCKAIVLIIARFPSPTTNAAATTTTTTTTKSSMTAKPTIPDLEELEDMHLDEDPPNIDPPQRRNPITYIRRRRNAIIPLDPGGELHPRRNAVIPFVLQNNDDGGESGDDEIRVSHVRTNKQKNRAAPAAEKTSAEGEASAANPSKRKGQAPKSDKQDSDDIHYIRAGRRTVEDESGDIPTQFIVVARIDRAKSKFSWLSVATWQLNGLRIGSVASGDRIRDDDEVLGYTVGLDPDPFFVALNAASTRGIREVLLERLEKGEVGVQEETLDDKLARRERREAQESRMLEAHGPGVIYGGDKAVLKIAARQNAKLRFPDPWALPVALTRSGPLDHKFPAGLVDFCSVASDVAITSIHVVATFANEIDGGRDLRLKHFMQVAFEPDETLESAKRYFSKGDESAEFRGLENNRFLAKKWWLLELWVLPHRHLCSMLYKWDDVPELTARAFCDAKDFEGEDVEPKLYVEVRIVQDPAHLGGESEDDVVSSEDEP
jgi:hypothetical protein